MSGLNFNLDEANIFLYILIGAVFLSVLILILAIGLPAIIKRTPKTNIKQVSRYGPSNYVEDESNPSFYTRVGKPLFEKAANLVKKMSAGSIVESTRHNLELAGLLESLGVDGFLGIKLLIPFGFLFLAILVIIFTNLHFALKILIMILIPFTYLLPDLFLKGRISKRREEMRLALSNALDLLTISVEAGMGFNIALAKVAGNIKGPLGEEFEKMLHEIQIGFTRKEAFKNLDKRTDIPDFSAFIIAMIQAEVFGVSIGKVLRVQAAEIRTKRRQRAEEEGAKAPLKLVFPVVLCLFPAILVVILGPAIIRIYDVLLKNM
ncbi:MAG: type II secretion system F family protein [Candidatus Humimicrobiaceae bacterium]